MNLLKPDLIANNIYELDFKQLKAQGIKALLLDIDDTLIPRTVNDVSPKVYDWINDRKAEGFKLCLTSNSRHPLRVKHIGEILEVPYLSFGLKPLPFAFFRALKLINAKAREAAMIGDQLFMDILGGNLVKIYTIYVKHMTKETFLPRQWMRAVEKWLLSTN